MYMEFHKWVLEHSTPPTSYFSDLDVSFIIIVVLYEHMCVCIYTSPTDPI